MTSAALDQAAQWNNQGALLLASGHFKDACASFDMAMKLLDDGNIATKAPSDARSPSCFLLEPIGVTATEEEKNANIYTKALTFSSPSREWYTDDVMFFCAVIKFNAGLALHVKAQRDGSENGIREAFRFYQQGLRFLKAFPDQSESQRQEYATVLAVANMNNMAQILFEFNQVEKAKVFMSSVRTLLASLEESDIDITFDQESVASFVWNEFFFSFTSDLVRGAPAA